MLKKTADLAKDGTPKDDDDDDDYDVDVDYDTWKGRFCNNRGRWVVV